MSDTYTKLFSSITESTIVSEPVATRWLWVTLLAMADAGGCVYGTVPGLARRANITLEETETALATFYAPDAYSRTKEHDGRRIVDIDGGWRLLNHAKYAAIRSEAERAEYKRDWDRQHRPSGHQRAKQSDDSPTVRHEPDTSPTKHDSPTPPALTPTPVKQEQKQGARAAPVEIPEWLPADAWQDWHQYRNSRKGWTHKARHLSIRKLTELWAQGHDPRAVIEQSIECGWTGLFPLRAQQARAGPVTAPGKTMQGIMALEAMKSGNRMAAGRTTQGVPEATFLGLGTDTGG